MVRASFLLALLMPSTQAFAQRESASAAQQAVFVGVGQVKPLGPGLGDSFPWSLGYLYRGANSKVYWGADLAGEGTQLNNTSGNYNVVQQGLSLNLLIGRGINLGSDWRAGAGGLIGFRQTGKSCPDSYLGYECYADEDPSIDYAVNYGAMIHVSFSKVLLGARASGESVQVMLGIAF